jgi:RNA polymerase sigma factor (sigma-70 family)
MHTVEPAALPLPSDAPLLAAARLGDAEAIAELYSRHRTPMTAVATRHAFHDYSAQDLVSEAFARMLRALANGRGPTDNAMAYLAVSVRNLSARHGRRTSHRHAPALASDELLQGVPDPRPGVEHGLLTEESAHRLRAALAVLPPRWRDVLLLTQVEGLGVSEAARHLGISPQACSALAYRTRRALRAAYLAGVESDDEVAVA